MAVGEDAAASGGGLSGVSGEGLAYIERFASVLVAAGFPGMSARVLAALHVTNSGRLSAAELGEMLQISPAAVSGAVRYLSGIGLVHKERVPGSRRDYYRMPPNVWQEVVRMQGQVLVRWAKTLAEGIDVVGPGTPAGERMAEHAAYFEFINSEYPALIERWEAHRAARS
jgi:predicted transcriptional regulator